MILFANLDLRAPDVKCGCGFSYTSPRNWSPCNYYKTTLFILLGFIGYLGFGLGWFFLYRYRDSISLYIHLNVNIIIANLSIQNSTQHIYWYMNIVYYIIYRASYHINDFAIAACTVTALWPCLINKKIF